jgi:hypothetical protein
MIIVAKYASSCACCSQPIQVGSKIEWRKGAAAKHAACAQGSASTVSARPAARRSFARRGTWMGCSCGSVAEFTKSSDCWTCRHDAE